MDLISKHITLVGLGRTSLALAELLLVKGAHPYITEMKRREDCGALADTAASLGVTVEFGGHSEAAFADAEIIVPSPGVSPEIPMISSAAQRGIPVQGELELAGRFCSGKVIAVTGTNGKTTTTSLIHAMVRACGHDAALAGNNDTPFSAVVMQEPQSEYVVLEVSSYQLETVSTFRPWIGAVLNLTNDHLGRHNTMENYALVKAGLLALQGGGDTALLNEDDSWVHAMPVPEGVRRLGFSMKHPAHIDVDGEIIRIDGTQVAVMSDIPLKGRHNVQNVLAALGVMDAGGFNMDSALEGLRSFQGVEHRIEFVDTVSGVAYYNDSKATNLDSLKVALESFNAPVVLIAGGEGKGSDYAALRSVIEKRVGGLVLIGADAAEIKRAWGDLAPFAVAEEMDRAVTAASDLAKKHDLKTVVLSPACASFDQYANFEERGTDFKACVAKMKTDAATLHSAS
jgi:UDP-N-acetylmuramoylalanine--D-glutamate ligase